MRVRWGFFPEEPFGPTVLLSMLAWGTESQCAWLHFREQATRQLKSGFLACT